MSWAKLSLIQWEGWRKLVSAVDEKKKYKKKKKKNHLLKNIKDAQAIELNKRKIRKEEIF